MDRNQYTTHNLFRFVPDNFFVPLAAPGRQVYWECILRIFRITGSQLSFGVERDILVEDLQYYFDSEMAADFEDDVDNRSSDSRDRANLMLRRLENYGWITVEVDYSYIQRVNFRDYAIQLIRTLMNISGSGSAEYQGYIYTIYNLVKSGGASGVALLQIADNTEALITALKSLNSNIKTYIDELTKHSTVSEILEALLNDYYSNVVDKAYHRLLTSDNVSKFRPEIIDRLEAHSRSTRYLNAASKEIAEIRELSGEDAREEVLSMLHNVIRAFRQMDEILDEINRKNTKYQRAAINRARFLLSDSDDVQGQLKDIISYMNENIQEFGMDLNGIYEMEELSCLIKLFSWNYLDMDSLYAPVEGKKSFQPQEMEMPEIDEEERKRKRQQMREKLDRILSQDKIDAWVLDQLAGRDSVMASDLLLSDEHFIRLIYVRLYGTRKKMSYRLDLGRQIEKDGYRFRDFRIIRR
ncbi:MAG: hypothetical protein IJ137_12895 [Eubacterium sp.]|nr:hypothetical protein [Eubacterium sp.]